MSGDDCEIEYLDEDEEIVQQCVQSVPIAETVPEVPAKKTPAKKNEPTTASEESDSDGNALPSSGSDLLVERKPSEHKRKKPTDSDSDYDPRVDMFPPKKKKKLPSLPKQTNSKSFTIAGSPPKPFRGLPVLNDSASNQLSQSVIKKPLKQPVKLNKTRADELQERKRLDIRIPDFEDPLCMPARALRKEAYDSKLLKRWNNLCLEHIKVADRVLKPDKGNTVSSCRTIVFKNTSNVAEGKVETSIWGKTWVANEDKVRKSEIFQGTLPRYKDHHIRRPFKLLKAPIMKFHHVNEVILTKEEYKDEEMLVVYRPTDAVSAVYKNAVEPEKPAEDSSDSGRSVSALREVASCHVCAACYHASWRGAKLSNQDGGMKISCLLCHCSFVSVYNLLAHVKRHHKAEHVRRQKAHITKLLAKLIDYHYKCRLCKQQFLAIKDLRRHLATHKGSTLFKCEVGDHMTY